MTKLLLPVFRLYCSSPLPSINHYIPKKTSSFVRRRQITNNPPFTNKKHIHIRSYLSANTFHNEEESMDEMLSPELIDVDCNLLHPDLLSISSQLLSKQNENDDINTCVNTDPTYILSHPSTVQSNIIGVLSPSSTIEESIQSLQFPAYVNRIEIRTTVGIHPYHTGTTEVEGPYNDQRLDTDGIYDIHDIPLGKDPSKTLNQLDTLIQTELTKSKSKSNRSNLACVGECGLDYSPGFPPKIEQIVWCQAQIQLAYKHQLPLFLHERLAFQDIIYLLDQVKQKNPQISNPIPIIIHCFTGTMDECEEYISRGYYISVSGFICKPDIGQPIRQCLVNGILPLSKLMIETDAPYMGFESCRSMYLDMEQEAISKLNGKKRKRLIKSIYPNVPSSLVKVLDCVTDALNEGRTLRNEQLLSRDEVAQTCKQNAIDFFSFSKDS